MKKHIYAEPLPADSPDYPLALALHVRNLIVLIVGQVPVDDRETRNSFLAVMCELERRFDMLD
jgi:hypothetical protein